jgi:PAS domain S-box-containing protein
MDAINTVKDLFLSNGIPGADIVPPYWQWLMAILAALVFSIIAVLYVSRLNLRLREAKRALTEARDNLAQKVQERTNDLEERHRKLERISKDWNDAFDAIGDPIFIHDTDMRIVRANPAYCRRAGHTLEEMSGHPYYRFFPRLEGPLPSCLVKHERLQPEGVELQLPDDETFVSRSFSIMRADKTFIHSIHILEDVSDVRRAEARRRTMSRALEQAGEGVMILGGERRIVYCNPALRVLLGIREKNECKAVGTSVDDIVSKQSTSQLRHMFEVAKLGEKVSAEMELAFDEAGRRPVFITLSCLQTDDGQRDGYVMTVLDLSELRRAEQEMQRLNRALRTLSRCNMTLVHACDEQTLMNDICRTLIDSGGYRFAWIGYTSADVGDRIFPVAWAGHEQEFIDTIDLSWAEESSGLNPAGYAIRNREPYIAHDIAAMPDAYRTWRESALKQGYVSVVALPLISEGDVFGAFVLVSAEPDAFDERELALLVELSGDLAFGIRTLRTREEHRRAEQALIATEKRYEDLYEKAPNGYLSISREDGTLMQFNQALCEMLGYERAMMREKTIFDLCAPVAHGRPLAEKLFKRFAQGAGTRNAELQMLHADGHLVWVSVSLDSVKDEHEIVRECRASITDITARKQAEAEQQRFAVKLQTSLLQTIEAIALTIEKRDPYTAGHQERVAQLAVKIGECMGLDAHRLKGLHLGAMIHDIGKISIPAEILNRPGMLEPQLFNFLKTHPRTGHDIIKGIDFPWPLADMVLHHHEYLDGSGYPDGLKGDEISLESRILVVADVVEAMASHRPYRPARGKERALREIEEGKATLYDPEVVDCCLKIFREQGSPWSEEENLVPLPSEKHVVIPPVRATCRDRPGLWNWPGVC